MTFQLGPGSEYLYPNWGLLFGFVNEDKIIFIFVGDIFSDKLNSIQTDLDWNNFKKSIEGLVAHEGVHIKQMERVNPAMYYILAAEMIEGVEGEIPANKARDYLGMPQETMAFALQAIKEYEGLGYSYDQMLKLLRKPNDEEITPNSSESDIFWNYVNYFEPHEKPFRRFLNYIYGYIQELKS